MIGYFITFSADYEKARKKLKQAEVTSDLQTDAEEASQANFGKRNKRFNVLFFPTKIKFSIFLKILRTYIK